MPQRTSKACLKCGRPTDGLSYYCPEHKKALRKYYQIKTAQEKGYDAEWSAFSSAWLSRNPKCRYCERPAKYLHHIKPIRERPDLKYSAHNLEQVCSIHHGKLHRKQ